MKNKIKSKIRALVLGLLFLAVSSMNLPAIMYYNGSGSAFNETSPLAHFSITNTTLSGFGVGFLSYTQVTPGSVGVMKIKSIEEYVVIGASSFLQSHSDLSSFLSRMELGELGEPDHEALTHKLGMAINNMEMAVEIYKDLKKKADKTPYKKEVIEKLRKFKYDKFRKKNNLREDMIQRVKQYLAKGKIREMYGNILSRCEYILDKSKDIKEKMKSGDVKIIDLREDVWMLNLEYIDSITLGQYVAQVFGEINKGL